MKKILVTGANGFIGSHLVKRLTNNYKLDAQCRNLPKEAPSYLKDNFIDFNIHKKQLSTDYYDYLINCIAYTNTTSNNWDELYKSNCVTTLSLLRNVSYKNFIQLSSFSLFSKASIKYSLPDPINLYGLSKLVSEKLVELNSKAEKSTTIIRLPIVIGGTKSQSDLINYFFNELKKNKDLDLYNEGKLLRNIVHVNKVTECIECLIQDNALKDKFNIFHVNSADMQTVYDICIYMKEKIKSKSKINFIDKRNMNDFDSKIIENNFKLDNFSEVGVMESLDYFLNEMVL